MSLRTLCVLALATMIPGTACEKPEEDGGASTREVEAGARPSQPLSPATKATPPPLATLAVQVEATKANGKAWDVRKGLPDIAVCFKDGEEETCLNGERDLLEPYC